jgi:hypothetical protein
LEQRVRALAEGQWRESVVVVYLDYVRPTFDVPGRRKDGTVKVRIEGKRLVGRIFSNILYGIIGVLIMVIVGDGGAGGGDSRKRRGRVTGPKNAQVLGFVDAARSAGGPAWLVYSPSHVALVTMGPIYDPENDSPPKFVWHAAKPNAPLLFPEEQRLTWSDGSVFEYHVGDVKAVLVARSMFALTLGPGRMDGSAAGTDDGDRRSAR